MKNINKIHICFILVLFSFSAQSQSGNEIVYDKDSEINVRLSDKIEKYKNDKAFDYTDELQKEPETLWQRFLNWLSRVLRWFFDKVGDGGAISWIFYIIIFGILAFAVIKLLGLNYQSLFFKNKRLKNGLDLETYDEDIHSLDLNKIIADAESNQEYRKAVRYLYLKLLKILTDREIIIWEINKTNKDYRKEMRKSKYNKDFNKLTHTYEYVWYGDFKIDQSKFSRIKPDFKNLYSDLK